MAAVIGRTGGRSKLEPGVVTRLVYDAQRQKHGQEFFEIEAAAAGKGGQI